MDETIADSIRLIWYQSLLQKTHCLDALKETAEALVESVVVSCGVRVLCVYQMEDKNRIKFLAATCRFADDHNSIEVKYPHPTKPSCESLLHALLISEKEAKDGCPRVHLLSLLPNAVFVKLAGLAPGYALEQLSIKDANESGFIVDVGIDFPYQLRSTSVRMICWCARSEDVQAIVDLSASQNVRLIPRPLCCGHKRGENHDTLTGRWNFASLTLKATIGDLTQSISDLSEKLPAPPVHCYIAHWPELAFFARGRAVEAWTNPYLQWKRAISGLDVEQLDGIKPSDRATLSKQVDWDCWSGEWGMQVLQRAKNRLSDLPPDASKNLAQLIQILQDPVIRLSLLQGLFSRNPTARFRSFLKRCLLIEWKKATGDSTPINLQRALVALSECIPWSMFHSVFGAMMAKLNTQFYHYPHLGEISRATLPIDTESNCPILPVFPKMKKKNQQDIRYQFAISFSAVFEDLANRLLRTDGGSRATTGIPYVGITYPVLLEGRLLGALYLDLRPSFYRFASDLQGYLRYACACHGLVIGSMPGIANAMGRAVEQEEQTEIKEILQPGIEPKDNLADAFRAILQKLDPLLDVRVANRRLGSRILSKGGSSWGLSESTTSQSARRHFKNIGNTFVLSPIRIRLPYKPQRRDTVISGKNIGFISLALHRPDRLESSERHYAWLLERLQNALDIQFQKAIAVRSDDSFSIGHTVKNAYGPLLAVLQKYGGMDWLVRKRPELLAAKLACENGPDAEFTKWFTKISEENAGLLETHSADLLSEAARRHNIDDIELFGDLFEASMRAPIMLAYSELLLERIETAYGKVRATDDPSAVTTLDKVVVRAFASAGLVHYAELQRTSSVFRSGDVSQIEPEPWIASPGTVHRVKFIWSHDTQENVLFIELDGTESLISPKHLSAVLEEGQLLVVPLGWFSNPDTGDISILENRLLPKQRISNEKRVCAALEELFLNAIRHNSQDGDGFWVKFKTRQSGSALSVSVTSPCSKDSYHRACDAMAKMEPGGLASAIILLTDLIGFKGLRRVYSASDGTLTFSFSMTCIG